MLKLTVYVPATHLAQVKAALFGTGAGRVSKRYDQCAWQVLGEGQFRPRAGSRPFLGKAGTVERVPEYRVEMLVTKRDAPAVVHALKAAHPYEEPAYDLVRLATSPATLSGRKPRPKGSSPSRRSRS